MKIMLLAAAAATFAAAVPAMAAPSAPGEARAPQEAGIPFVSFRTIRTFQPEGDETVFLEAQGRWYRASLHGPCFNLRRSLRIDIDNRFSSNRLDNTSTFIVDGERCPIESLVAVDGPPPRRPRR